MESDILSLSSTFGVRNGILYDLPLKAMHHLRNPGEKIVLAIADTCTYSDLLQTAHQQGATDTQLAELIGFLNMIGAMQYRRSLRQKLRALYAIGTHAVIGTFYAPLSWRQPATPVAALLGILRATWPVAIATAGTTGLAAGGGLVSAGFVLGVGTFGLLLFGGSLFVHEMIHILIARRYAAQPQLLQRGLRIGVVHRKLGPQAEALSSIAGPMGGTAVCFTAAFLALALELHPFALLGAIVGAFHVFSLLPWYGDGASFSKALRER